MAKAYSLHIGLNAVNPAHYDGWSGPLNACEADVETMQEICAAADFKTSTLLTADATREAVIMAIQDHAARLKSGDIFVLSYSGHGGQIPDIDGDEPDDGLDETWCLYDGEMLDDELHKLWSLFQPGVRIVMFSDSCHSGTVARKIEREQAEARAQGRTPAAEPVYRVMPPDVQLRTYKKHRDFYDRIALANAGAPAIGCSVILISGCQDDQLSMDGAFNGAFTGALKLVWAKGAFKGNYAAFTQKIVDQLPETQTPNYFPTGAPNPTFEAQQVLKI